MVCWGLWNRRHKWLWDKANGSAFGVLAAARKMLGDWKETQIPAVQIKQRGGVRSWEKPSTGWVKINVDTAIFGDSIGCGAVIRNADGSFLGARCRRIEGVWSPREAEAIALKEALSWIMALQYEMCVFETDSKVLVHACNGDRGESRFGTIVDDCV